MIKKAVFCEKNGFFNENMQYFGVVRKFANRLCDPDGIGELMGFLWLLKNRYGGDFPPRYYISALYHEYIRLSRIECRKIHEMEIFDISCSGESSIDFSMDLAVALSRLSRAEYNAILLDIVLGYGTQKSAEMLGISRQAFHRNKKRGLEKLRSMPELEIYT